MARQDLLFVFLPALALIAGLVVFSCARDADVFAGNAAQLAQVQPGA